MSQQRQPDESTANQPAADNFRQVLESFVTATSDAVYRMSADWRQMNQLVGKSFLLNTVTPSSSWMAQYIPPQDQYQVQTAINAAIAARKPFELAHRIIRADRSLGWTFSRAMPILNEQGEIVDWFGTATDITDQKQVEKALAQSEAKYRTLFDSIDEGVTTVEAIFDEDGQAIDYRFLEHNPLWETLTGFKPPIGAMARETIPGIEEYWINLVGKVARTGQTVRTEYFAEASYGRWYSAYFSRVGGEGSHQVVCVYNDITQRKRREANLVFLADTSADFAPLSSAEEIMERVGERLARHLQLSRCAFSVVDEEADWITTIYEWRSEDSLPGVLGSYPISALLTQAGRQHYSAGKLAVIPDTRDNWLLSAPSELLYELGNRSVVDAPYLANGRWKLLLTVVRPEAGEWPADETELIQELTTRIYSRIERACAEEALRESEEKFRLLSIASSNSIYIMNPDWTQMHQLIGKMFLADTTDSDSTWLQTYIPIEDQSRVQQVIQEAIRTKTTFELEHRVLQADGTVGWTFSRAIPMLDEQDAIWEWLGAASDITARKQAEEALRVSDRRKSEFLAMLAHELRNPMSTLHNTLLLLGITHGQDESLPLDRALGMMSREVSHLNRMIDDLLDVSRISQGKIHLSKERLDLGKLIRQALEAARSQFASRGQVVTMHLPEGPVWVIGDPTRLTQVMRNLVTNAIKYTPKGGQIEVTLEKDRGQAIVRIRDRGIGIASGQLKAIFEVFVQVSASLDRLQGGLGLDLAVVKQLVELHGGHVWVNSAGLGQGSEFTVSLPGLPDRAPQRASAGAGDGRAREAERILVVDDNADLAMTTAMLLRHRKYDAHTCLSGPDALEAVEVIQPVAILLDLGMPGMDGFETCRRLRELEWGKYGVIVALSGYGQAEDKKRTKESGFDGHLVKPLNLQALTELLDELLGGSKLGE